MAKTKVQVLGLQKALKNLKLKGKEIKKTVWEELEDTADNIRNDAILKAPRNTSRLRSSIQITKLSDSIEVGSDLKYAPFMEFGTKSQVDIPPELQAYARQFKGKGGSFDELVESITVWANQKGIDQDAIIPIALKIARDGVKPRPFLFPAYFKHRDKLIKKLPKLIKDD
jgi:HK97 gp10 family phage protein